MDSYLHENSILNLFYAGFDTFYCVLDKPNGVYNFKMRNKYSRTFLLERGVLSYTKEMMEASMELLKKNGVGVIPYSNGVKSFPQETITDINAKTKNSAPNSKENSFFIFYPSNDELESSILDNFKLELDNLEVKYGVVEEGTLIVEEQEIAPENFIKFLRDNKVWSLFYAGAHLNNEIIWSEYGVLPMYIKSRYQLVRGIPQPYVINDLVFMAQSASMDKDHEKATILNHYRKIYNITSTTLLDSWQ